MVGKSIKGSCTLHMDAVPSIILSLLKSKGKGT